MITQSEFETRFAFLREKELFLACSGGVDSMVMVYLITSFCEKVHLLHVNYHLRGADSDGDEVFVRDYAKSQGLSFDCLSIDLKKHLKEQGGNLQDEARNIRYDWFQKKIKSENSMVLLAHHLDDQVETFYQHLGRKSGILGLSCMPEYHDGFLRPLLQYSKDEIYAFAREHQLTWREDQSNQNRIYTRNKLRNEFLPFLFREIPDLKDSVRILIQTFQENRTSLEEKMKPLISNIAKSDRWNFSDFDQVQDDEFLILFKALNIPFSLIPALKKLRHQQKGKLLEATDLRIVREEDHFALLRPKAEQQRASRLNIEAVKEIPDQFNKEEIYLDESKITGELRLTTWEQGERIDVLGLRGSKLISDILKEAKVPSHERKNCLVLRDDVCIHWLVGYKIARNAIAGADSVSILKIRLEEDEKE